MDKVVRKIDVEEEKELREAMKINTRVMIAVYILLVLLGVGTGYLLARVRGGTGNPVSSAPFTSDKVVGSTDATTFKDSAEGVVEAGGMEGEGSHKLVREGGPSQTAYLVSSIVDLDQYVGKKVRVWGQTMAAKKVSWLMDVGKIELLSE